MSMIIKQSPGPLFQVADKTTLRVRTQALVCRNGGVVKLAAGTPVKSIGKLIAGTNYDVSMANDGTLSLVDAIAGSPSLEIIGGAHFALGGCAPAYNGGNKIPQWNPFSLWDHTFRPACPDPRGMALINGRFWSDIFLFSKDTASPDRKILTAINAFEATALADRQGKTLPTQDEYQKLALGVRECTSSNKYVDTIELDAPRTSRFGIMQATGAKWIWLHVQSDPTSELDTKYLRAGLAGGSWVDGAGAGSRACYWNGAPSGSGNGVGLRARSDHLCLQ